MHTRAVQWMRRRGWKPLAFQERAWDAMARGASGLLHSPTGTGKTLAAALGAAGAPAGAGRGILWITPLRALAADLAASLVGAFGAVEPGWRVGLWNGDVPSATRQKLARAMPEVLVTTPESLAVMLSRADLVAGLRRYAVVVADEWHELARGKRGALLQLNLSRLSALNPRMLRWGLSATLGNPGEAAAVLGGFLDDGRPRPMELIAGGPAPEIRIEAVLPEPGARLPWAGHLGLTLADAVAAAVRRAAPALVFTNTRSQAELWHGELAARFPAGRVGLHHGSLDESLRSAAEEGLRTGALDAVVATSSLDLGVDFPPVRSVFQVGSPKGIARLVQRAGRAGHRPGGTPRIFLVPTNFFELAEIAAARRALELGRIEPLAPPAACLDVLCQHVLTVAAGGGFDGEELYGEVRRAHAYRGLDRSTWQWVLDFAATGGRSLGAYPDFHRLERADDGRWVLSRPALVRRHRMSVGTITSDAEVEIVARGGRRLGRVEEAFVSRLRRGDVFQFGGGLWRLERLRDMRAEVSAARAGKPAVPQWMGGKMPLSTELAACLREVLAMPFRDGSPEMSWLGGLLEVQAGMSAVPGAEEILAETHYGREGFHVFIFPFEGRDIHEGLAALFAHRLRRDHGLAFSLAVNDYGLELLAPRAFPATEAFAPDGRALSEAALETDILECLNTTELARRRFREIARIAGLSFEGFPGRRKSSRQLQISTSLLFDVFERYEPGHPLVGQARGEVLESVLGLSRLARALDRLRGARWVWKSPGGITPFAFPLYAERLRNSHGAEDLLREMEKWGSDAWNAGELCQPGARRRGTASAARTRGVVGG